MTQATILAELLAASEARRPAVLAVVVSTDRSVPRRAGAKMIVYADGTTSGTVGGGSMEANVIDDALACLASGRPNRVSYSLIDPASGDPGVCGGEVELYLEPFMPQSTVYVVGAGHVGQAVIELAGWLGHRVVAWDDRADLVETLELNIPVLSGPIDPDSIDEATMVVVVTRNVDLDLEILPPILASRAAYIGLMGSQRRWDLTRSKLVDLGLSEEALARVHNPIGVEISAETPSEIAVSIMAEVISNARS